MKVIGYIATTIILMVYSTLLDGWAIAKLWAWFIVPTFSLQALTIAQAIGFALVVSYLTHQIQPTEKDDEFWVTLLRGVLNGTFKPLLSLLFGAVVRMWM